METPRLKITTEQDSASMLFRELFLLNIQLENNHGEHLQFQSEINEIVTSIDRLMEKILQQKTLIES